MATGGKQRVRNTSLLWSGGRISDNSQNIDYTGSKHGQIQFGAHHSLHTVGTAGIRHLSAFSGNSFRCG